MSTKNELFSEKIFGKILRRETCLIEMPFFIIYFDLLRLRKRDMKTGNA